MSLITACREFGTASFNLGAAAYHSYRAASRYLKVPISLTLGLGGVAVVVYVARIAFRQISAALANPPTQDPEPKTYFVYCKRVPGLQTSKIKNRKTKRNNASEQTRRPSTITFEKTPPKKEVAKNRNRALTRLFDLLETHLISPWIEKNEELLAKGKNIDPLFDAMIDDKEGLKAYLRAVAFWQLSVQWQRSEKIYIDSKLSSPPSLNTITREVKECKIESNLEKQLISIITSQNDLDKVSAFQEAVNKANLEEENYNHLLDVSKKLRAILQKQTETQPDLKAERAKLQAQFARGLDKYLANILTHASECLLKILKELEEDQTEETKSAPATDSTIKPSNEKRPQNECLSLRALGPDNIEWRKKHRVEGKEFKIQSEIVRSLDLSYPNVDYSNFATPTRRQLHITNEVNAVVSTLSRELDTNYTQLLYEKEKGKIGENIAQSNTTNSSTANYLSGQITEEAFFKSDQATKLSTGELSSLFFFKMLKITESKKQFKNFTLRLPKSLLDHIKPSFITLIDKTMGMIENLDMKKTVVNFFYFLDQIFDCCEVVKESSTKQTTSRNMTKARAALSEALEASKIDQTTTQELTPLYSETTLEDVQGRAIIDQLGQNAHPNLQATKPHLEEKAWLRRKLNEIKDLLRTSAQNEHWLSTCIYEQGGVAGQGLIKLIHSVNDSIKTYSPFFGHLIDIAIFGAQALIEEKGIDGVQEAIDNISKPGKLSSLIGISMLKQYLDLSKMDKKWKEDLEIMRTIYSFLSDEEQKKIKKHLEYLYQGPQLQARTEALTSGIQRDEKIGHLLAKEKQYKKSLHNLRKANRTLHKNQEKNEKHIEEIAKAYAAIELEMGLVQFERSKGLAVYVAEHKLRKVLGNLNEKCLGKSGAYWTYYILPDGTKQVVGALLVVIEQAFNLLKYQKVVKHLIFTAIDLVIQQLKNKQAPDNSQEAPLKRPQNNNAKEVPSIFEIAEQAVFKKQNGNKIQVTPLSTHIMNRAASFASSCNQSGLKGWGASFNYQLGSITGTRIWEAIKNGEEENETDKSETQTSNQKTKQPKITLNEKARITSKGIAQKIVQELFDFGKNPNGLSAEVIEKLIELYDPRSDSEETDQEGGILDNTNRPPPNSPHGSDDDEGYSTEETEEFFDPQGDVSDSDNDLLT